MQPQKLIKDLQDIQTATNKITIASAAVSHATGEFIEFLGSDEDLANAAKYTTQLMPCLKALTDALEDYTRVAIRLYRGGHCE